MTGAITKVLRHTSGVPYWADPWRRTTEALSARE